MRAGLLIVMLLLLSLVVRASPEVMHFQSEAQEQQYRQLTAELRCPKCQNNSIADSGSVIAADLRQKVYQLVQQGQTRQQIVDYMVARYGHFITYDPPLTPLTLLLWLLPLLAAVSGGYAIYARSRWVMPSPAPEHREPLVSRGHPWGLVAGIAMALAISAVSLFATTGYRQVLDWQQSLRQLPELMNRAVDPKAAPLKQEDLRTLARGLRSVLHNDDDSLRGWIILGRVGMQLNDATLATQAYGRAHAIAPDDLQAASGYAEVLTRTDEPEALQQAAVLLQPLLKTHPDNLRILQLAANNAYHQKQYDSAISRWERVILLSASNAPWRAELEKKIALARQLQTDGGH